MMMVTRIYKRKDKNLRTFVGKQELFKRVHYFLLKQSGLSLKNRALVSFRFYKNFKGSKYSLTRVRNRCLISSRSRSVYRRFRLNRLTFKHLVILGYLPGYGASS